MIVSEVSTETKQRYVILFSFPIINYKIPSANSKIVLPMLALLLK